MPKFTIHILLIFVVLLAKCQVGDKDVKTIKVGLTHGKSHSFTQALELFEKKLEKKSKGKLQVEIYHSAQLGGEKEMQEMLTIGSIEMSVSGVLNTCEPMFSLFEMPYLYQDREHVMRVNNSEIMEEVALPLEKNGIKLIGFYENGFRNITNSVRAVNQPADMQGLLIRTPENAAQIETMKALGAIATPMSFSELYTALVQGVVDGQENPLQNIWFGRLYEAQEHLAMTRHIYNSAYVLISKKCWDKLSEKEQALLKKCLDESTRWQLDYMENLDKELEQKMKNYGVKFTYPDKEKFETACQPAYEVMYERYGQKARRIVQKIKELE